ncbi:MAG: hypothetical protein CVU39_18765 [Chloroflexi bacterium HGW-Chloroflexi-10]|nr:MAG: hypothetical protein CVU39_18765 [Chloroflexi bacterium HGW-Chloroflexi-10]
MKSKNIIKIIIVTVLLVVITGSAAAQNLLVDTPVSLGDPGFSLAYTGSVGVVDQPYVFSNDHLNSPEGLFADSDKALYIAEREGARIIKFNAAGDYEMSFGVVGRPYHHDIFLNQPSNVIVDASDNVWVVYRSAIKKYTGDGNFLQTYPEDAPWEEGSADNRFSDPYELAFSNDAKQVFVSDSNNHRVQIFAFNEDGVPGNEDDDKMYYTGTIDASHANIPGNGLESPKGLAVDSSGNLYIADFLNQRILSCAYNGGTSEWDCSVFFGETDVEGTDLTHLRYAPDIFIDASDQVFIADGGNSRVLKCTTAGNDCALFAGVTDEPGVDNGHFSFISAVTTDVDGNVYVSDNTNKRVQMFNSSGVYQKTYGELNVPYLVDDERLNQPRGVAADTDGSYYVVEYKGLRLIKYDAHGNQLWTVGEAGVFGADNTHFGAFFGGLEGNPAVDANHKVYVADTANNRIQVFNADGTFSQSFGEYGGGTNQFDCPSSVAISPVNEDIYVADSCNQRVQVFTKNLIYRLTLGILREPGNDNLHFDNPVSVAIDHLGYVYVGDLTNTRVQRCTINVGTYNCTTFIGAPRDQYDSQFGKVAPRSLAVDPQGRLYVADEWGGRVQVFDSNAAFLTSIGGGEGGQNTSQFSNPGGVALDQDGNLYVSDVMNYRVQKFAPGVPNWQQVNINGFGNQRSNEVTALTVFGDDLYAAMFDFKNGAQLWRQTADNQWSLVVPDGFGERNNTAVLSMVTFKGKLYAGTLNQTANESISDAGQIWRSSTGDADDWDRVVTQGFGQPGNFSIYRLAVLGDYIYAVTFNPNSGTELWRSDTGNAGDWDAVMTGGFGHPECYFINSLVEFNGAYYASTDGFGMWSSTTGASGSWDPMDTPAGWGGSLQRYQDYLYMSINHSEGPDEPVTIHMWRCQDCDGSDWEQIDGSFDNNKNSNGSLEVYRNGLYLFSQDDMKGLQIRKTTNGADWEDVSLEGFGDSQNRAFNWWNSWDRDQYNESRNLSSTRDEAVTVFADRLYVGTINYNNGGEIWASDFDTRVFLPLLIR